MHQVGPLGNLCNENEGPRAALKYTPRGYRERALCPALQQAMTGAKFHAAIDITEQ